jgi:hypothetical protein
VAGACSQGGFDPGKPNLKDLETFRERVMLLQGQLFLQEDFAKKLAENYAEALKQ